MKGGHSCFRGWPSTAGAEGVEGAEGVGMGVEGVGVGWSIQNECRALHRVVGRGEVLMLQELAQHCTRYGEVRKGVR